MVMLHKGAIFESNLESSVLLKDTRTYRSGEKSLTFWPLPPEPKPPIISDPNINYE